MVFREHCRVLIWTLIDALAAPQAALMTTIAQGIFSSHLAWEYIFLGMGLGVVLVIVDLILKRTTTNY